jgi:hypothetical protein
VKRLLILGAVAYGTYRLIAAMRELAQVDLGELLDDVLVVDFGDEEAL